MLITNTCHHSTGDLRQNLLTPAVKPIISHLFECLQKVSLMMMAPFAGWVAYVVHNKTTLVRYRVYVTLF